MQDWWSALEGIIKCYYIIGVLASFILIVQTILSFIGVVDSFDEIDSLGEDIDEISEFKIFSFRSIIAFFAVFGWVGVIAIERFNNIITFFIAFISGLLAMFVVAGLFYMSLKLQSNGNIDYNNCVGKLAKVYLTIPAKNKGEGKINLKVQDTFIEVRASTYELEAIKTGEQVEIIKVLNDNTVVVKKIKGE